MKIGAAIAVLLMLPSAALGQGNQGPFAGLFGRTPERVGVDYTMFDLRSLTSVQLDNQVLRTEGSTVDGGGIIGAVGGSATFDKQTTRLRTTARGLAYYNEFIQTPRLGATTVEAGGSVAWKVGTRFSVDGGGTYRYSPYFQFYPGIVPAPSMPSAVPGVVPPVSPYITGLIESDSVDANAGFTSFYSKRATLSMAVSRRQTTFRHTPNGDYEMNGVRGLWTRRMTRDLGIRLGYTREETRTEMLADTDYLHETIEAGVDFIRPMSLTRSTTLAVRTQSSVIGRKGRGRHFRLDGGIQVAHWFSRTWRMTVDATRNTELLPGFTEPLFSDSLGVSLSGLVSPRTELIVSGGGGQGYFGIEGGSGRYQTASASTYLGFAVTRKFGLFAQHAFYFYELPQGVSVLPTTHRMARQTVTVGATVWVPIINRERSPSDSR